MYEQGMIANFNCFTISNRKYVVGIFIWKTYCLPFFSLAFFLCSFSRLQLLLIVNNFIYQRLFFFARLFTDIFFRLFDFDYFRRTFASWFCRLFLDIFCRRLFDTFCRLFVGGDFLVSRHVFLRLDRGWILVFLLNWTNFIQVVWFWYVAKLE